MIAPLLWCWIHSIYLKQTHCSAIIIMNNALTGAYIWRHSKPIKLSYHFDILTTLSYGIAFIRQYILATRIFTSIPTKTNIEIWGFTEFWFCFAQNVYLYRSWCIFRWTIFFYFTTPWTCPLRVFVLESILSSCTLCLFIFR